ncbi:MAG: SulP family inorganic anion transporter [Balneolaceae bacterium]|nr:SulP family inorganic anion transporter [Balneolaceae bacterium]
MLLRFLENQQYNIKNEVLAGLTVSLALVPEAVAFSLIAGLSPLVGLYSAFIIGLITAVMGGRPGMISGATGAIAVVIVSLVMVHGPEYLFAAVVLMGLIQLGVGFLKLGKFIRLVPHPVVFGFVNGLAILIFMSQLNEFKFSSGVNEGEWLTGSTLYLMLALVIGTMAIIYILPRITKAVPPSLAAIGIISGIVIIFGLPTRSVGDIASISGGLPDFHIPVVPLSLETLLIILPYSFIMAMVGIIESLLTLTVVDEMTETRGSGNKECVAQGTANVVTGFFGGMGGCAMIGQSIINVSSGGRSRISGIVAAVSLLIFILFGAAIIEQIPMAALVGLMIMVAIGTFEWASLKILGKVPMTDVIVMVMVMFVTVVLHNLALAVLVGVVISALAFAWENAKRIRARKHMDEDGARHYQIYGPLFFASVATFHEKFDVNGDPDHIYIDFRESRIADHSAIDALNKVTQRYQRVGKRVSIINLDKNCKEMLNKAGNIIALDYNRKVESVKKVRQSA